MSRGSQASIDLIRRSIHLYHLMKLIPRNWVWVEERFDIEFPEARTRWPRRNLPRNSDDIGFISRNTIRRWVKNPKHALIRRCSNLDSLVKTRFEEVPAI